MDQKTDDQNGKKKKQKAVPKKDHASKDSLFSTPPVDVFGRKIGTTAKKKRGRKPKPDTERVRPRTLEEKMRRREERRQEREKLKLLKEAQALAVEQAEEPAYMTIARVLPQLEGDKSWNLCTEQERIFIYEYFASGFQLRNAWRKVYGPSSEESGMTEAKARFSLGQPHIAKALKLIIDIFMAERKVSLVPRLLAVLESQAFYDPLDFIDARGELKVPLEDLTYAQRLCIEGIDTKFYGKDADREVSTVKLVNRNNALDKLIKYAGLLAEIPAITQNIVQNGNIQNVNQTALPRETQLRLESLFAAVRSTKAK